MKHAVPVHFVFHECVTVVIVGLSLKVFIVNGNICGLLLSLGVSTEILLLMFNSLKQTKFKYLKKMEEPKYFREAEHATEITF